MLVNDIHSQLNETEVDSVIVPESIQQLSEAIRKVKNDGKTLCLSGGRHAMGGQQFRKNAVLIDLRGLNRIHSFDQKNGLLEVEAGIEWPRLIEFLHAPQNTGNLAWSIIQKQTGADRMTLGGSLAANVHGRGLSLKPIINDVQSISLIDANGNLIFCDRIKNPELFQLAIGGYGLFGVIAKINLRLTPRKRLLRKVEIIHVADLMQLFQQRVSQGFLYGDFQFSTERDSNEFLTMGVFSCYQPVSQDTPQTPDHKELTAENWIHLYTLGHTDHKKAFELYSQFYLSTSGQIYDSDTHQLSYYLDDYHKGIDQHLGLSVKATEMITEIYVPRNELVSFLQKSAEFFRRNRTEVFYGTVRLIEKDEECFLAWARESYVCIIFNLHITHNAEGLQNAKRAFRKLIDLAIERKGSYYLTYHRWATRKQVETCYPQFVEFLRLKKRYDPEEFFQSEWYRHYKLMFQDRL